LGKEKERNVRAKCQGHALLLKMQKASWSGTEEIQARLGTMTSSFADTRGEVGAEAGGCSSCWTATCLCSSAHFNTSPNPLQSAAATGERATQTLFEKGFWGGRMGMCALEQLTLIPSGTGKMHCLLLQAFS